MIEKEDYYVKDEEDLRDLNRRVISLGEKFDKPVVATCDVHFLNPEDEIYRRIIMAGKALMMPTASRRCIFTRLMKCFMSSIILEVIRHMR